MNRLARNRTGKFLLKLVPLTVVSVALAGCSMGNLTLSGPSQTPSETTVGVNLQGKVHGGQQNVAYSSIKLFAVGTTGYGSAATDLTKHITTGTARYYPGGTTGCNPTALSPTAYVIAGGTATYTAVNTLIAGQLVAIADASPLNGTTAQVTTATANSFTVTTTASNVSANTDTANSITPVCYAVPTTDQNGNFTITADFSCGTTNGSSIVYLTATGGNPGLSTVTAVNSNLALSALLQLSSTTSTPPLTCSQLSASNYVIINELSTAAMGIAMGQFFTPTLGSSSTDSFGAPSTNLTGITNAASTALTLVNTNTGIANSSLALTSGSFSVTATPEAAKLNTIANILAACVNSAGGTGACSSLFSAIEPATQTNAPTDTLQAAAQFGVNPNPSSANSTTLYNLASSTSPFVGLATQPADFSIGISYTDTSSTCTTGAGGTCILNDPQEVAFDASGNLWVMNHNSTTSGSLSELSALGAPLLNTSTIGGTSFNTISPRNMAIDNNGNILIGTTTTSYVFQYNPGSPGSSVALANGNQPYAPVIDSSNNVYYGYNSTSTTYSFAEFVGGTIANTSLSEYPVYCSTTINAFTKCNGRSPAETNAALLVYGALDTNGNIWFSPSSPTSGMFKVSNWTPCSGTSCQSTSVTYTLVAGGSGGFPTIATPLGIAAGPGGLLWVANHASGTNTIAEFTAGFATTAGSNFGSATSLNQPNWIALDGAANAWVTNGTGNSVSEFQGTGTGIGTILSPTNTGTAPFTTVGYSKASILAPFGAAVDLSGNLWIANNTVTTGGLTEIVGVAAPVITPVVAAVTNFKANGTAKP